LLRQSGAALGETLFQLDDHLKKKLGEGVYTYVCMYACMQACMDG
jgi:hypothetical protein